MSGTSRLADRRVLVLGGGQQTYGLTDPPLGIGRAICELAATEGARVAVADIDQTAAQITVDQIVANGGEAKAFCGDAASPEDAIRMMTEASEWLGGITSLVLNTGIARGDGLKGTSVTDWDLVMAVNVRSHFLALQAASELVEPNGAITLTSSTAALVVSTSSLPAYIASKAALEGLARAAAKELGPKKIRVNIVMPGLIDTSLGRLASMIKPDRDATPIPLGRQGSAWDVANAHVFLLSQAAAYITGVTLPVDGGLSQVY
ncbi:MAG: SDR family oxidoreductase [Parvibaculaceae bacterium]|nr:SDR family oxidoreductase [Parvibaculaceae bacterium]